MTRRCRPGPLWPRRCAPPSRQVPRGRPVRGQPASPGHGVDHPAHREGHRSPGEDREDSDAASAKRERGDDPAGRGIRYRSSHGTSASPPGWTPRPAPTTSARAGSGSREVAHRRKRATEPLFFIGIQNFWIVSAPLSGPALPVGPPDAFRTTRARPGSPAGQATHPGGAVLPARGDRVPRRAPPGVRWRAPPPAPRPAFLEKRGLAVGW